MAFVLDPATPATLVTMGTGDVTDMSADLLAALGDLVPMLSPR